MNQRFLRTEHILYAAALTIALLIRLLKLESAPFSNDEAALALQAWESALGKDPLLAPHPAYIVLTSLVMYIFNASAWTARFWPALAGSLIVLLPALFRDRLGSLPAVALAFFLALDPGLLAVSRQAGSLPLALFFTLLALGLWRKGFYLPAGIAAGMALLSGPAFWHGLAALGIASLAAAYLQKRQPRPDDGEGLRNVVFGLRLEEQDRLTTAAGSSAWRKAIAAGLVTVLLAGTLFFSIPNGLSAAAGGLAAFLRGWALPAGAPTGVLPSLLLIALAAYALLPLIFGLWGGLRGLLSGGAVDRFLLMWFIAALVLALVYPGRAVSDLLWAILPLWALATRQGVRLLELPGQDYLAVLGQALLSTIIFAFVSLTAVTLVNVPNLPQQQVLLRMAIAVLMLAASTILIGWGWSRTVAVRGLVLGLSVVLLAYTVAAGWDAAGFTGKSARDLFAGNAQLASADLITGTIENLDQWTPPQTGGLEVVVLNVPSPALRWELRNLQRVRFVENLPPEASPGIVISPDQPELALSATYRGQRLVLSEQTAWNTLNAADWFRWMVFRSVPAGSASLQHIILWARVDLFPGEQAQSGPGTLP